VIPSISPVTVNGTEVGTPVLGSEFEVPVVNTDGDPVGTWNGTSEVIADAHAQLQDTAGGNIGSAVDIPAEGSVNIEAPDGSVTIKDSADSTLHTVAVKSNGTAEQTIADGSVVVKDSAGATLHTVTVKAEGSTDQTIADGSVQLKDSAGTNIGSAQAIKAEGSLNVTAPDASAVVKDSAGVTISTTAIKSNASADITAPDGSVQPKNSAGTSLGSAVAVKSNGTADASIGDSTITKPDGTTVGLPATVALDVRTYRSGIAYARGRQDWSGDTNIYHAGDEGSLFAAGWFDDTPPLYPVSYAKLATFTTLQANNIWGNTNRFTDRTGAAPAGSGDRVFQDHFKGYEVYIAGSGSGIVWTDALDNAEAFSDGTFSDWHTPSEGILRSWANYSSSSPLNYSPFNLTVNLWTCTTNYADSTQARRFTAAGFSNLGKTTATPFVILVRKL
jgi:hypothetical protein